MGIARGNKVELFEETPVRIALAKMALPTIMSQLITLIYNMADTWFIGRTNNPYMVAASSLVLTIYLAVMASANLFGVGGGTLAARLLGAKREDEARRAASLSLVLAAFASLNTTGTSPNSAASTQGWSVPPPSTTRRARRPSRRESWKRTRFRETRSGSGTASRRPARERRFRRRRGFRQARSGRTGRRRCRPSD